MRGYWDLSCPRAFGFTYEDKQMNNETKWKFSIDPNHFRYRTQMLDTNFSDGVNSSGKSDVSLV